MNTEPQTQPDRQATVLLLAGDAAEQSGLSTLLRQEGFNCHAVACVLDAERAIASKAIDLLIICGLSSICDHVARFRRLIDAYLPVIAISDELTDDVLDHHADMEIDAVILRPINFRLLLIKIRSSLRLRQLYQLEFEHRKQLQSYSEMLHLEQEVAAKIFNNILKGHFLETEAVKAVISPMSLFNGDIALVAKSPDGQLHVLLGDFTGHGLSASIAAKPTALIFSGMTQKGFAIGDIVTEINAKLQKMLPVNIFLAATVVALNPEAKTLSMITCGLPEHFLVDEAARSYKTIPSVNIPLGIQADMDIHEQVYNISGGERLYLLTDGIFEAENVDGEPFGSQRIIDAICEKNIDDIENLQIRLAEHCGGLVQKDDITFVRLICDVDKVPWRDTGLPEAKRHVDALTWKYMMEFDISTLREINPVPLMVNTAMEIQGLQEHRQAVFMIVSELFTNALDHGLLDLDSGIKAMPDGFMDFYALKEERLRTRSQGKIRFLFVHRPTEQGGRLTIKVWDSGAGFDWQRWTQELDNNLGYCGRGVRLVETLCTSLIFQGRGNRVEAVFDWEQ
ncbi:MAG: SpoIIE family protein phosphatase [Methylococcaceae bacterium]|nr:SpoIIE family protein phosphatase [Methylococcaceae bacterium]